MFMMQRKNTGFLNPDPGPPRGHGAVLWRPRAEAFTK